MCVHESLHELVCVWGCEWNFIFVNFLSDYVAKLTFNSQSNFWFHSGPGVAPVKGPPLVPEQTSHSRVGAVRLGEAELSYISRVYILWLKGTRAGPGARVPAGEPCAPAPCHGHLCTRLCSHSLGTEAVPLPRFVTPWLLGSLCTWLMCSVASLGVTSGPR